MAWISLILEFFKWEQYIDVGIDAGIYFILAITATLLFMVRLALSLLFGMGEMDDFNFETGEVDGHVDSTGAFTLFSLLSILAFFMGTGWMGLSCRVSWGMDAAPSAFAATGFGFFLMMLSSTLMYGIRKLSHEAKYDVNTAVGATGRVYLRIPAKGEGRGQVEVNVSGRRKVMHAVSTGEAIDSFAAVRVVDAEDDETLVVEAKH